MNTGWPLNLNKKLERGQVNPQSPKTDYSWTICGNNSHEWMFLCTWYKNTTSARVEVVVWLINWDVSLQSAELFSWNVWRWWECWAHRTDSVLPTISNDDRFCHRTKILVTFTKASYMSVKKFRIVSLPRDWPSWRSRKRMSNYRGQEIIYSANRLKHTTLLHCNL